MNFFPILERELRVRARSRVTFWTRSGVALIGALFSLPALLGNLASGGSTGKQVFEAVITIGFLLSACGCLFTAATISTERAEGTLGLLFLTRVRSLDLLLGKLGSAGVTTFCALAAFAPVLMIPILAGGVTGGEAVRKMLVLLNTLFFSLAAGLAASAATRRPTRAVRNALIFVGLIFLGPLMWWEFVQGPSRIAGALSPVVGLLAAGDFFYRRTPGLEHVGYWISICSVQALGWILLTIASLRLRPSLLEQSARNLPVTTSERLAPARISRRSWLWRQLASPIEWRVHRQRGVKAAMWVTACLTVFFLLINPFLHRVISFGTPMMYPLYRLPLLGFWLFSKAFLAWAVTRFFSEARRTGELEWLLTTPLGASTIVSDQWIALKGLLRGPVLVILGGVVLQFTWLYIGMRAWPPWPFYMPVMFATAICSTLLSVAAACWTGMWFGLKARHQVSAIVRVLVWCEVIPFLISTFLSVFISVILSYGPPSPLFPSSLFYIVRSSLPTLATLIFYWWLLRRCHQRLAEALRRVEPESLTLSGTGRQVASLVVQARHWTPRTGSDARDWRAE